MTRRPLLALVPALLLAACGQTPAPMPDVPDRAAPLAARAAWLARQPQLQDAESQALLARYGADEVFVASVERAFTGEAEPALPATDRPDLSVSGGALSALDLASTRLAFVQSVSWGTVANYNREYANQSATNAVLPGLDWSRDGCSAPDGLGLGYREDFRPACNVHDFGYRNLKVYARTDANRKTTDDVFQTNMNGLCAAKSWYKRPPCYAAAYAYYQAVRVGGASSF